MRTPIDRSTDAALANLHLRIVIKNGLILLVLSFVMGTGVGWALTHWGEAPAGAAVGGLVGAGFVAWFCMMWIATNGLLDHVGARRDEL